MDVLTKYFSGEEAKEDEIGWARGKYGGQIRRYTGFSGVNCWEEITWKAQAKWLENLKINI
jgi:hypothetical protein